MTEKFNYSIFFRLFYFYGNIPFTLLLIFYVVQTAVGGQKDFLHLTFMFLALSIIFLLNKKYFQLYKYLPRKIRIENDKIITEDFFLSNKIVEISLNGITQLKGGIFDGKLRGMMMIIDEKNNEQIVFSDKIRNYNILLTVILNKITKPLYDEVISKISSVRK